MSSLLKCTPTLSRPRQDMYRRHRLCWECENWISKWANNILTTVWATYSLWRNKVWCVSEWAGEGTVSQQNRTENLSCSCTHWSLAHHQHWKSSQAEHSRPPTQEGWYHMLLFLSLFISYSESHGHRKDQEWGTSGDIILSTKEPTEQSWGIL